MKRIKRNIVVIGVVSFLMCLGTSNLNAQRNKRLNKDCPKGIEFNDQQKEQIKKSKLEFAKATKDLRNELNELRAQQNTLMSADKPDLKAIYANIDKSSDLKNRLKKLELAMKLNMKSVFTEEQKVMMANRPMRNRGMNQAGKAQMGNGKSFNSGFGKGFNSKGMKQGRQNDDWMNLSDEQKVQMKEFHIAHMKESKGLRNEMEVLQLKQKHLMTYENLDKKSIMENIDRLSGVQNKLNKMKVDHKLEVRKILTEDQLCLYLSHSGTKRGFGNGNRHRHFNN